MKSIFRAGLGLALVSCVGMAGPAFSTEAQEAKSRSAFATPVKGVALLGITQPATKVVGKDVVTMIKVKNLSKAPIAGLKVAEYWYDKEGNLLPGSSKQLRKALVPDEVQTIELRTVRNPKMDRNTYQFTHANGQVNTRVMTKIE